MPRTAVAETKTYILELYGDGQQRVTVPASWKLTFGPAVPYTKQQVADNSYTLRFYEGNKENLRAVFGRVISFRDASIPIQEKVTKIKQQTLQKATKAGARDVHVEARVTEWVNPDAPADEADNDFLQLEHTSKNEF